MYHQAAWQDSDRAFQNTHVDVHLKAVYILALKESRREGDQRGVVRAHEFSHEMNKWQTQLFVDPFDGCVMSLDTYVSAKPYHLLAEALQDDLEAMDLLIRERMQSRDAPLIPEVAAHLVDAGGKRVRPMLTLAVARLFGYRGEDHHRLAATVEFIHTATLLHDDVVDEGRQRRGRPSANLLWDNKSSVLVGDYLFARSFQLMVETGSLPVMDVLSHTAAMLAESEVLQLSAAASLATTEEMHMRILRGKTAALFSAAAEVGGIVAGATERQVEALREFGDAFGIAFQIADDLLDYFGDAETTGKEPGNDFRERKLTLPVIKAIANAGAEERAFWWRTIERGEQRDGDLEQALELIARHDAAVEARDEAREWSARAKEALEFLPDHELRDMLHDLAEYVVVRLA